MYVHCTQTVLDESRVTQEVLPVSDIYPTPCIHRCGCGGLCDGGHPCPMADNAPPLCPRCQAAFDEDPQAWEEFGDHPEGLRSWEELKRELAAAVQNPTPPEAWDGIPF